MSYTAWSVNFADQPSASKWNVLGANDASFNDGTGIAAAAITSVHSAPVIYKNALNFTGQGDGVETVKSTITIPSQTSACVVLLFAAISASYGNGTPTLNVDTRIRQTNTAGTVLAFAQMTKDAAIGVTQRGTSALMGIDSLPVSTSRAYVLTDSSNVTYTVNNPGSNFIAIVFNSTNATLA